MSKKIVKKQKKHGPSWSLALVAILTPVFSAGIAPLFAEEATDTPRQLFDYSLFDSDVFLMQRRLRHSAAGDLTVQQHSSSSSNAAVNPCDPTEPATSSVSSSVPALTIDDLTLSERETLRRQLRNHACPDRADPAYLALCRKLLKSLPAEATRTGLWNANQ